jgi:predicted DNA-binding protein (UPF0251 family)
VTGAELAAAIHDYDVACHLLADTERNAVAASLAKARAARRIVDLVGSQYEAAKALGLHESTISKMINRARKADTDAAPEQP